jgi:hypothetical protein
LATRSAPDVEHPVPGPDAGTGTHAGRERFGRLFQGCAVGLEEPVVEVLTHHEPPGIVDVVVVRGRLVALHGLCAHHPFLRTER